jgi:uncharacterized RmlC-like cupin family protein
MSSDWRNHGDKIIPSEQLDTKTPQTPGMSRAAAITRARTGATKLWAGSVQIHANAKTGPHHHGELESIIYVVSGKARMRWGDGWNLSPKRVRAILSSCRRMCRTRKSMQPISR